MCADAYFWTLSALLQGFAALVKKDGVTRIVRARPRRREEDKEER